jgi:hypothetical protein
LSRNKTSPTFASATETTVVKFITKRGEHRLNETLATTSLWPEEKGAKSCRDFAGI